MLLWCPPGNNTMGIVAVGLAGTDFESAALQDVTNPAAPNPLASGHVSCRVVSYETNVDDGAINTVKFGTADAGDNAPPANRYFASQTNPSRYSKYRTVASSVTGYFTAPSLDNQGSLYVYNGPGSKTMYDKGIETHREISRGPYQPEAPTPQAPWKDGVIFEVVEPTLFKLPFTEAEMTSMTNSPYVSRATDGFYSVMRPTDDEFHFAERNACPSIIFSSDGAGAPIGNSYGLYAPTTLFEDEPQASTQPDVTKVNTVPWVLVDRFVNRLDLGVPVTSYTSANPPWLGELFGAPRVYDGAGTSFTFPYSYFNVFASDVAFDSGFTHTVAIVRGMSKQASWAFKRLLTIEGQVTANSPARPYAVRPPPRDGVALQRGLIASRCMPPVFPASANNFGSIVKEIAGIAKTVINAAAAPLSALAPELAPVLSSAAGLASFINSVIPAPRQLRIAQPAPKPAPKAKRAATVRRNAALARGVANARRRTGNMTQPPVGLRRLQ